MIAFSSHATNLSPDDSDPTDDVFVRHLGAAQPPPAFPPAARLAHAAR